MREGIGMSNARNHDGKGSRQEGWKDRGAKKGFQALSQEAEPDSPDGGTS